MLPFTPWRAASAVCLLATSAWGAATRLPLTRAWRSAWPGGDEAASLEPWRGAALWGPGPNATGPPAPWPLWPAAALELVEERLKVAGNYSEIRESLLNQFDLIYTVVVKVGTPGRPVRLVVDTGSSDLWIAGDSYQADRSKTASLVEGPEAQMQYGQGHVSGQKVRDRVCLRRALCVEDQTFVSALQIDGITNMVGADGLFDGLLGLAYPALSAAGGITMLQMLLNLHLWPRLSFGLSLQPEDDASFLTLGNLDDVLAEAPAGSGPGVALPVWSINSLPRFWLVSGTADVAGAGGGKVLATLDSGTSLIAVPGRAYPWLMQHLIRHQDSRKCGPWMGLALCPCSTVLRPLTLSFSGKDGRQINVTLTSQDLLAPVSHAMSPRGAGSMCRVAIQPGPDSMPFWILGDVFLRHFYAVHDVSGLEVVLFSHLPRQPPAVPRPQQQQQLEVSPRRPGGQREGGLGATPAAGRASGQAEVAVTAAAFAGLSLFFLLSAVALRRRWHEAAPAESLEHYSRL